METLSCTTAILPPRMPLLRQVRSFPFSKAVMPRQTKLLSPRSSSLARNEAVYPDQGRPKDMTLVGMFSVGFRSISSWWLPLFNLLFDTGKSLLSAVGNPAVSHCLLPSLDLQESSCFISTSIKSTNARPEDDSKQRNTVCAHEYASLSAGTGNVEDNDTKKRYSGCKERKPRRIVKFTAEKAKMLRKQTRASETWHDVMYHSAIASRLAIPDS